MNALIIVLFGGLFVLVFIGIGAFLIYFSLRSRKKADASQSWPSINGQVTESRVDHSTSIDSDGDQRASYTPVVRYTYQVMGQTYTGKNISFGGQPSYGNPGKAQAALERFPAGEVIAVYYNPENPSEAVLERQAGGATLSMVIGIIFLLVGLCLGCPMLIYTLLVPFGSQ